jgi:hypothetical protein
MFGIVGETILAHGEAVKSKAEGRQYTPGESRRELYKSGPPPEKEEELARPPGQGLTGYATYRGNDEGAAGGEAATEDLSEPANPAGSRQDAGLTSSSNAPVDTYPEPIPMSADPGAAPDAGMSFHPGAASDAGMSFDPGAALDAGTSFDPSAAPDTGISFDPGAVSGPGVNTDPAAAPNDQANFDPGAAR